MMKNISIIVLISLAGVLACKTKEKQTPVQQDVIKACYRYIANNDTVSLYLDFAGNRVDGTLFYNLYEKDKNEGTIIGEIKGDTIIAEYTFLSEGVTSASEVVFLKRNNHLIQGFGETTTVEGKQVFKKRSTLDFNDSLVLTATECKD